MKLALLGTGMIVTEVLPVLTTIEELSLKLSCRHHDHLTKLKL